MNETRPPIKPCPICGRPGEERFKPFCSARCADADLGNWLTGRYAIPAAEEDEPGEEAVKGEAKER